MMTSYNLVGDIGGTNARLALADPQTHALKQVKTFSSRDFPEFAAVLKRYLAELGAGEQPRRACFAVASPISGDWVAFTNNPWTFSIAALKAEFGFTELQVINDFQAIAMSLPHLGDDQRLPIGGQTSLAAGNLAVIGPGTGLGMAVLVHAGDHDIPLATEGGHAGFAPADRYEWQLWDKLAPQFEFLSKEDVISGQGLSVLHQAVCELEGQPVEAKWTPAEVTRQALEQDDPLCRKTLEVFCGLLGAAAGDYALQTGARGGVFIAGGIIPRFRDLFLNSRFRQKFEAKGRFRAYVEAIPTFLITAPQPGLIGAAATLENNGARR